MLIPLGVALAVSGAVYLLTQVITLDINSAAFSPNRLVLSSQMREQPQTAASRTPPW